jgi:hypothetical protein
VLPLPSRNGPARVALVIARADPPASGRALAAAAMVRAATARAAAAPRAAMMAPVNPGQVLSTII